MLYVSMGVCQAMLNQLAEEADGNTELATALEQVIKDDCRVRLFPAEKNGQKKTFSQRVQKSHFGWPDFLYIVGKQEKLMQVYLQYSNRETKQKCKFYFFHSTHIANIPLFLKKGCYLMVFLPLSISTCIC